MTEHKIDGAKAEAFANRVVDLLNGGALAVMISIGHRGGLFDVMSRLPASTSAEIAESAGLNERYVREWLGSMVVGKIVDYDPEQGRYVLPAEHATCLTRASSPNNTAVYAQYIPLLGAVEDKILECFKNGGGVPYSEYDRFHEVMAEDSGQTVVAALVDSILPLAPGIPGRLEKGIDVLDIGCGRGRALLLMAERFPESRFVGYDLSAEAIEYARSEVQRLGLSNVTFDVRDLTDFKVDAQFDFITAFDAIHDQARPDLVLEGVARSLHPDGVFLMQDIAGSSHVHNNIDHPVGALLYTVSCMHCMTVSLAQGGYGLGAMWGEEKAHEMIRDAGFKNIEATRLPHDFQNVYYIMTGTVYQDERVSADAETRAA